MTHIVTSDYRSHGAAQILSYISRDENQIENRAGQEMTGSEIERFIRKSEEYDFERQFIVSPESNGMSNREMAEATRDTMNEYFADAETVDYCYAIHQDTDSAHVHVVATGEKNELYMDQTDLAEFRELSEEHVLEHERDLEQELYQENGIDHDQSHERLQQKAKDRDQTRGIGSQWSVLPMGMLGLVPIVPLQIDVLAAWGVLFALIGMVGYGVGRKIGFMPSLAQHLPGWSDRFIGPIVVFGFGFWLVSGDVWFGWVLIGSYALYKSYRLLKGTWSYLSHKSIIKSSDFAFPKRIKDVGNGFKGRRWSDVVRIDSTGSLMFLGTTRSGKTESMFTVVYQMLLGSDGGPFVVYDRKDDWKEFLAREDLVVVTAQGSTHTLNIFEGVEDESEFDFIARSLFPKEGGSNQFFQRAARQVFTAGCKYLHREFQKEGETPTHADLVRFFRERTAEDIAEAFDSYADMTAAKAEIDPNGASEQAMSVFASVQQELDDIFVGEFADAPGEKPVISLREYWENPDGRVLLLDHPHEMGSTVDPMFRYLIDRSIQLSLEDPRQADFVLDEFAQIPHLRNIGELVNVGAGRDTRVVVAIQSVSQLFENYGRDAAKAILSGMMTVVILRLGDDESISYARDIIGTEWVEYTHRTETKDRGEFGTRTKRETKEEEEHPFARGEFTSFDVGYSIVVRPDGWAAGQSPQLWGKTKERIDRAFGL